MKSTFDFDQNPTLTDNYYHGPRWFIPGYDASHAMYRCQLHAKSAVLNRRGVTSSTPLARSFAGEGGGGGARPFALVRVQVAIARP